VPVEFVQVLLLAIRCVAADAVAAAVVASYGYVKKICCTKQMMYICILLYYIATRQEFLILMQHAIKQHKIILLFVSRKL